VRGYLSSFTCQAFAAVLMAAALATGLAVPVRAQQSAGDAKEPLTFDLAAVKPTPADERRGIVHQPPGGQSYECIGATVRTIMTVAYTVTDRQISGGPAWINTDRWNIEAKAERRGTSDELHTALAKLIEERFHLKIRHEKRELPVYILTVDKKGAKMAVHDPADLLHDPIAGGFQNGEVKLTGKNVAMDYFAFFLSRGLDLNVIDRTELPARYDVEYHYVPDLPPGAGRGGDGPPLINGQPVSVDGPNIFTALREQLGLRLEKGKGPVDFLVIEQAEKPTEN
jgi:uncharacterized protein (TIGR03435 family)